MKIRINNIFKILFVFLCFFIMYKVNASDLDINGTGLDIPFERMTCSELVGPNLVKIIHLFITIVRIVGAIIAIVSGMLTFVPAVASDDADALKKAYKKAIQLFIILVVIGIFPSLVKIIGKIAGLDLSCL